MQSAQADRDADASCSRPSKTVASGDERGARLLRASAVPGESAVCYCLGAAFRPRLRGTPGGRDGKCSPLGRREDDAPFRGLLSVPVCVHVCMCVEEWSRHSRPETVEGRALGDPPYSSQCHCVRLPPPLIFREMFARISGAQRLLDSSPMHSRSNFFPTLKNTVAMTSPTQT